MTARYELGTAPPARRALAERLSLEVATAAAEFVTGSVLEDPRRVGKPLGAELAGIYSARVGRDWRVLYEIDDAKHLVIVLDIRSWFSGLPAPLKPPSPHVDRGAAVAPDGPSRYTSALSSGKAGRFRESKDARYHRTAPGCAVRLSSS